VFSITTNDLPCVTLTDWWRAEGNTDDSVGANNGVAYNITYTEYGASGEGFTFNGSSSHIAFGTTGFDSGNFGTNNFVIDFWMETTEEEVYSLLSKRPTCGDGSFWDIRMDLYGFISAQICDNSSGTYLENLLSIIRVNDGNFHEITFIREGKSLYLYVDGYLQATATTAGVIDINNTAEMNAGWDPCVGSGTDWFDGVLDEIKLGNLCN